MPMAEPKEMLYAKLQMLANGERDIAEVAERKAKEAETLARRVKAIKGRAWVNVKLMGMGRLNWVSYGKLIHGKIYIIRRVLNNVAENPVLSQWDGNLGWRDLYGEIKPTSAANTTIEVWL